MSNINSNMSNVSIIAFVVLCLALFQVCQSEKWKCGKAGEKEIDEVFSKLVTIGRDDRKFPTNKNELKIYCK